MPDIASSIKFSSLERDPEVTMPPPNMTTDWKSVRLFPIPSIVYLIHNNVQFATLAYVDTSTYQIMGNLKIVTTGILFRFGAIFNMARLLLDDFRNECEKGPWWQHLFNGYSITTWLVMLDLGSTGFLFSWSMTICKGVFHFNGNATDDSSVSIPFDFRPTLQLFLGIVVCMMSLHMYFAPTSMLIDLPKMINEDSESLLEVCVDRRIDSA